MKKALYAVAAVYALAGAVWGQAGPGNGKLTAEMLEGIPLRSIGPANTPGRIADIAVDPKNDSTYYVAIASGGVWKSTNRGISWTPIFDHYGSFSMGCIVVDPKNPQTLWLGTGENESQRSVDFGDGVYKSTDGGAHWTNVGLEHSEHIGKIVIDPHNSDTVYVAAQGPLWAPGGDRGLYKTTDGGKSWKPALQISENTGVSDVAVDPTNPEIVYAAAYQRRRNVGVLIGGGPEGGMFKSTDGGAHFKKMENGIPQGDLGRIGLAISPQKPEVVYAWINAGARQMGFYKSEDRGETWVKQSDLLLQDPQYYGEITPDPHQFDHLFVVDMQSHETFDGGKTWRTCFQGVHVDHHAVWVDPKDATHWLEGNDGGLYETYDAGRQWRHFMNIPAIQYYRVAVDNAFPFYHIAGGAQDNGSSAGPSRTLKRAGVFTNEWFSIGGGDGFQPRFDPDDPEIVYSFSQNGAIQRMDLRTSATRGVRPAGEVTGAGRGGRGGGGGGAGGGGASPGENGPGAPRWNWDTPFITSSHVKGRIYMAGNKIYRSDNRGDSWMAFSPDLTRQLDRNQVPVMGKVWDQNAISRNTYTTDLSIINYISESPRDENIVAAGTDDGLVQITTDGGKTWNKSDAFPGVPESTPISCVYLSNHDANTIYVAFNNFLRGDFKPYVAKSTDLGKTWTNITANLPERHFAWTIVEDHVDKDLLFLGTEFGLWVTVDGGKAWTQLKGNMPTIAIRDLQVQKRETDLVAASFGRGIFVLDDYTPLRAISTRSAAREAELFPMRRAQLFNEQTYYRGEGTEEFVAPNAPFGAIVTYYLAHDFGNGAAGNRGRAGTAGGGNPADAGRGTEAEAARGGEAAGGEAEAAPAGGGRARGGRGFGGRGGGGAGTGIVIQIADSNGTVVRSLDGASTPGFHRADWDLRGGVPGPAAGRGGEQLFDPNAAEEEEADNDVAVDTAEQEAQGGAARGGDAAEGGAGRGGDADAAGGGGEGQTDAAGGGAGGGRGGRGGRGGGGRGAFGGGGRGGFGNLPLVKPGKYTVTLGHNVNGMFTPLAEPQTLEVVPLQTGPEGAGK